MSCLHCIPWGKCGCCGARLSIIPLDEAGTPICPTCGGDFNARRPGLRERLARIYAIPRWLVWIVGIDVAIGAVVAIHNIVEWLT